MAEVVGVERVSLPPVKSVTLKLTGDEAQILVEVLSKVGGVPTGPRKHAQAIYDKLEELGFKFGQYGKSGSLNFF